MAHPEVQNCFDIIRPYVEALAQDGMPPVQLLGGIGSTALTHEATVILAPERRIIAPGDLFLNNYRDDGNLRDIDTLVMSSRPSDRALVERCAKETMGDSLRIETFDFKNSKKIYKHIANPFGVKALKTFLSDRYLPGNQRWSAAGPQAYKALFPFRVQIPHEALEPWMLEIGRDIEFPVPAPGAIILNYLTRSISGLRPKDASKVDCITRQVFEKAPETADWIIDGPGASQYELAQILHTLREPTYSPQELFLGGKLPLTVLPHEQLIDQEVSMMYDHSEASQARALRIAQAKARLLHAFESNPSVVTYIQKFGEGRLNSIVHNH